MRKHLIPSAILTLLNSSSALARYDTTWTPHDYAASYPSPTPEIPFPVFLLIAAVVVAFVMAAASGSESAPKSPEEHDQEAARTRAKARQVEAETMLMESQARKTLKQAELRDVESFVRKSDRRPK